MVQDQLINVEKASQNIELFLIASQKKYVHLNLLATTILVSPDGVQIKFVQHFKCLGRFTDRGYEYTLNRHRCDQLPQQNLESRYQEGD